MISVGDILFLDANGKLSKERGTATSPIGRVTAVKPGGVVDVALDGSRSVVTFDSNKRVGHGPDNLQLMEESLETE